MTTEEWSWQPIPMEPIRSTGENEWHAEHLSMFPLLKHLDAFDSTNSLHFLTLPIGTLIAVRIRQLRFLKWKIVTE